MLRSILIGLLAGQRSMVPLAVIAAIARRGDLPPDALARDLLARPAVALGAVALTAGEMVGDKLASAPDRIIIPGLTARSATAAFAGAVLAPSGRRAEAAVLAAATALGASYIGWSLRVRAMSRFGQVSTGLVEDALVLAGGWAIATRSWPRARRRD